jgi:twitching motility protein PilT
MDIKELLILAKSKRASDLHLVAGAYPMFRIDGELKPQEEFPKLSSENIEELFNQVADDHLRQLFKTELEVDFAHILPGGSRGRCNACWQQGSISLAIRLLSEKIPTVEDLGLPEICKELIMRPRGLMVVTGPTGSGKSTTIVAMLNYLNNTAKRYMVTIEDPVEYVHPNINCAFSQRELAQDTHSFVNALKYVLRQDPDVILVGEMRDIETASAVLTVAETGHLVLSTGHAPSAAQSVERIVDLFPPP